ncbi:outer membrane beta-barrel protein [Maritalea sp.]|uniref:outer membrane beta-barrel protein n=1 Tax=Maritalea sp. TaxID=2003361 RepID=UPI003EF8E587
MAPELSAKLKTHPIVGVALGAGVTFGLLCQTVQGEEIFGGWDLQSAVSLRGGFEDQDGNRSHMLVVAPEFTLRRENDDLALGISGGAQFEQTGNNQFTPRAAGLGVDATLQLSRRGQANFAANYSIEQPRNTDPELPTDVKTPGFTQQFGILAGYSHQFAKTQVDLRSAIGRGQTADTTLNDDSIQSNADQNAWRYGLGARVTREITPTIGAFVDAQINRELYDTPSSALNASRNNWSYEAQVGAAVNFNEKVQGEVAFGQLRQTFDDAGLDAVQTFTYNAGLAWQVSDMAALQLNVSTNVSPTSVAGEAMRVVDVGRLTYNQEINTQISFSAFGEIERQHYQNSNDEIKTSRAGLGLQYLVNEQISTFANYSFSLREPTGAAASRRHMIEAGVRFNRQ